MSSDKVQQSCKRVSRNKDECGVALVGLPSNEQTRKFIEAARLTGVSSILSPDDALAQQIVEARVDEVGDYETSYFGSTGFYRALENAAPRAKEEIARLGVNEVLKTFPEQRRTALKNQADRFMEDARGLLQRLKK